MCLKTTCLSNKCLTKINKINHLNHKNDCILFKMLYTFIIVAECDANDFNDIEEEDNWLNNGEDCPYFDQISTGIRNPKNNKRKTNYGNRGPNKRFKRGKSKLYVHFILNPSQLHMAQHCIAIVVLFFFITLNNIYLV